MKKLLTSLLLAATLIVSCDKNEDPNTPPPAEYKGTKYTGDTIVSATFNGNKGSFTSQETIAYVDKAASSVSVTLAKACFTKDIPYVAADYQMPSLDIVLPNIPVAHGTRYAAENIVPTMLDGEPYGDDIIKSIDNVMVYIDGEYVTVKFDCTVFINLTGKGSENFTFGIEFTNYEAPTTEDDKPSGTGVTYDGTYFVHLIEGETETFKNSAVSTFDVMTKTEDQMKTLVANNISFGGESPKMNISITGFTAVTADSQYPEYQYDVTNTNGTATVFGQEMPVEILYAGFGVEGVELSSMIEFVYQGKTYEISFYNQDDVPSDRE